MRLNIPALWVFPSEHPVVFRGEIYHYMRCARTKQAADDYVEHCTAQQTTQLWSHPAVKPIRFSTTLPLRRVSKHAPASFWGCIDLDNGEIRDPNGKTYVNAFPNRRMARAFCQEQNEKAKRPSSFATRVSAPIQFFQQG